MRIPHDIEATIYFLRADEGGRVGPAFSDYRPQFYYDGHDWDARHEYPDVAQVHPGDTVRAFLGFMSPDRHLGKIYPGMEFEIREGARTVGRGRILKILELEESARPPVQPNQTHNMSIDTDPQQQAAASPLMLVVRSSSR